MFIRYLILAIPLVVAVKFEQFHLATTITGIFMVQFVILAEHLGKYIHTFQIKFREGKPFMGELGLVHQLIIPVFGYTITLNLEVIVMTWIVITLLIIFGMSAARKKEIVPQPLQVLGEIFVEQFYKLTEDALDREKARKYGPIVCALFMFLLLSNWLGIIPHLEEPTKDLNTPLSLGLMGFVIAHYAGIKSKGFKNYAKEYFQPIFFHDAS